eukprot:scaffold449743_cov51-Prasinocladus_malaysianus.AAC.1
METSTWWLLVSFMQDAVVAVTVMDVSMNNSSMLGNSHAVYSSFDSDPDAQAAQTEARVLRAIGADMFFNCGIHLTRKCINSALIHRDEVSQRNRDDLMAQDMHP